MLQMIGRSPRPKADLVGVLLECHGRIRHFSALAIALGERTDLGHGEIAEACVQVERYFEHAMPLHVSDEEDSVLPRLAGRSPSIDAALARMRDQHDLHESVIERVCAATRARRADPENDHARAALLAIARPLEFVLEAHLRAEEETIFPAIRAELTSDEQDQILRELRLRRLLDEVA